MSDQLPTVEELEELSHRAVVAYAACAARMVQPLFGGGRYEPQPERIKAVDDAIRIAERFAEKKIKTVNSDKIAAAYVVSLLLRRIYELLKRYNVNNDVWVR